MSDLLRYDKNQKYILFDWETCNLNLQSLDNKPWQLSYLLCTGDRIVTESDNYLYWPDLNISEDAARITHFNYEKYKSLALPPEPILDEFEKYLYDPSYRIIFHNGLGFDVYIHNITRILLGRKSDFSYIDRAVDTNCLAKAITKDIKYQKEDDFICWQYKLCDFREKGLKTSLESQLKKYKIDYDPMKLHDGIEDCRLNWEIFKKQLWEVEI